ncbi:hypothetical protein ACFC00_21060 [Streptomyces adustus]
MAGLIFALWFTWFSVTWLGNHLGSGNSLSSVTDQPLHASKIV